MAAKSGLARVSRVASASRAVRTPHIVKTGPVAKAIAKGKPAVPTKTLLVKKQLYPDKVPAYANLLGPRQFTSDKAVKTWKYFQTQKMKLRPAPTFDSLLERLPRVVKLWRFRHDQERLGKLAAALVGYKRWHEEDIDKVVVALKLGPLQQYALWTRAARNAFAPGANDKAPRMSPEDAAAAVRVVERTRDAFLAALDASGPPDSRVGNNPNLPSPAGLLDVLVANPAIPDRKSHIEAVLRACETMPKWSKNLSKFYRSTSHEQAIKILPNGRLIKKEGSSRLAEKSIGRLSKETWRLFNWAFPKAWVAPVPLAQRHLQQIRGSHYRAAGFAAYLELQKDHLRTALSPVSRALTTTPKTETQYVQEIRAAAGRLAGDVQRVISEEKRRTPVNILYRLMGLYTISGENAEVTRVKKLISRRRKQEEKELEEKRAGWAAAKAARKAAREATQPTKVKATA